jgi:hypothetical protein
VQSGGVASVVFWLMAALGLAVAMAHPRVQRLEQRLGVTVLLSSGLPFLLLGFILSLPSVGILSAAALAHLSPAFEFGLGWIGFVVGLQFDVRRLDALPRALGRVIVAESMVPMLTTTLFCTAAFAAITDLAQLDRGILRDALVLAACAAPSAAVSVPFLSRRVGEQAATLLREVTLIDEIACLLVLGVCAVVFRPATRGSHWPLPGAAWLLMTLGLGGVSGILTYLLIRGASNRTEEMALLIGSVAMSAGMAGHLGLSQLVIGAIAGALLCNLPLHDAAGLRHTLEQVERPLYLVFMLVAGAYWRPGDWQGWVLGPVFVAARLLGKYLGGVVALRAGPSGLPSARETTLALMPQSPIAVVAIVAAATLYGHDEPRLRWATTGVIVGGVLTELVVRLLQAAPTGEERPT